MPKPSATKVLQQRLRSGTPPSIVSQASKLGLARGAKRLGPGTVHVQRAYVWNASDSYREESRNSIPAFAQMVKPRPSQTTTAIGSNIMLRNGK